MIGFTHDTDCNSVMTYCNTWGTKCLWYGPNQIHAFETLYVKVPSN